MLTNYSRAWSLTRLEPTTSCDGVEIRVRRNPYTENSIYVRYCEAPFGNRTLTDSCDSYVKYRDKQIANTGVSDLFVAIFNTGC